MRSPRAFFSRMWLIVTRDIAACLPRRAPPRGVPGGGRRELEVRGSKFEVHPNFELRPSNFELLVAERGLADPRVVGSGDPVLGVDVDESRRVARDLGLGEIGIREDDYRIPSVHEARSGAVDA